MLFIEGLVANRFKWIYAENCTIFQKKGYKFSMIGNMIYMDLYSLNADLIRFLLMRR